MLVLSLALLAQVQQPTQAPAPVLPPSPVASIALSPTVPTVTAGDTLRLVAQALDAQGRPVPEARLRFQAVGGRFEGQVDSAGLVTSGSTGTLPVSVVALVPGTKPYVRRVEVRMVPGPAARIAVAPGVTKLVAGQRVRLVPSVYSALDDQRDDRPRWASSAARVASVAPDGMLTAHEPGSATITATAGDAKWSRQVTVIANSIGSLELQPASASARTGDVLRFRLVAKDRSGRVIEGLTPTWSFSPGQGMVTEDGGFVGYERGTYVVTASLGVRTAEATATLAPRDVRRPATVVGRLPRSLFSTEEVWLHPDGRHAYLGTGSGGDRMYALDISNPAQPTVTDSVMANTRRVNDIMTTPDGRFLVFTREGAADRKNGIVLCELSDPAHPRPIAEFTEGVTGGVHSSFVYQQPKYGTHVYLTNDGTGAMHVIDIGDPYHPREVAQWKTANRPDEARTLHDIDVQDGLAYLSYWNDGLVILDVGNGVAGGSPSKPVLVSQYKYDLNDLYRQVEASAGPGFIRGTHTAWRHRNYVFIADEVFPAGAVQGAKDAAAFRAYGRLQVVDVSDLKRPTSVAFYEPEYGGVHNVWVAGDTLYMGAYNAGFRAFDISGELRGDLRAQQREMVHVNTADLDGNRKNTAMTWGVVVRDGLAYVNDMNNGLWIVRMEPRREPPRPLTP
ncbi:MAG: Ig-like domain-containing protein [Gemmatimonadales bacterium]|nr:Ig-like domain-containing protein [Gemmatimonadales bacterium]